jgi:hypothetical protein
MNLAHLTTAFALTFTVVQAMPCNHTYSNTTNGTYSNFTNGTTNTNTTFPLFPSLLAAKLDDPSELPSTVNYSKQYAVFNGFFAVAILMAVLYLIGACAILYVTLIRKQPDEVVGEVEMDDAGKTGEEAGKPSFFEKIKMRLGKKQKGNEE